MSNSNIAVFHLTFSRSLSSCTARSLFAFARTTMRCDAMVHLQETDGRSWSEWKDNNTVNALSHWMELLDWIDGWIVSSADGLPLKSSSVGLCDAFYRARVHLQWHGQQVHRQILFTTVLMYLTDLWATCTATATTPFPFTHSFSSHGSDRIGSDLLVADAEKLGTTLHENLLDICVSLSPALCGGGSWRNGLDGLYKYNKG